MGWPWSNWPRPVPLLAELDHEVREAGSPFPRARGRSDALGGYVRRQRPRVPARCWATHLGADPRESAEQLLRTAGPTGGGRSGGAGLAPARPAAAPDARKRNRSAHGSPTGSYVRPAGDATCIATGTRHRPGHDYPGPNVATSRTSSWTACAATWRASPTPPSPARARPARWGCLAELDIREHSGGHHAAPPSTRRWTSPSELTCPTFGLSGRMRAVVRRSGGTTAVPEGAREGPPRSTTRMR